MRQTLVFNRIPDQAVSRPPRSGRLEGFIFTFMLIAIIPLVIGLPPHPWWTWLERVGIGALAAIFLLAMLIRMKVLTDRALQTERALRAAADAERAKLAHVLESTTDAFVQYDRDWRFVYVNAQTERLVGRPREQLLGRVLWEVFPSLVDSTLQREYFRAMAEQVPVRFETLHPFLDQWVEVKAVPFSAGLTVYLRDISERKRVELSLGSRLRQQGFVAALGQLALGDIPLPELLDQAVNLVATGLEVEYVKYLEILPDGQRLLLRAGVGWHEGCIGQATVGAQEGSQASFTLLSHKPVIVEDLRTETRFRGPSLLQAHGVVSGLSVMVLGKKGPIGILGAHSSRQRIFSEDDLNFLQAMANVLGQTIERAAVAETLRQSELQFRQLAENIKEVFYVTDPDLTHMLYISPAYEDVWGRPVESLYREPRSWMDAIHPDDRPRVAALYENLLEQPLDHEYRILRPDGELRWIRDRLFLVRDDRGRIYRHVGVAENITSRKTMEASLSLLAREHTARMAAEAGVRARDEVLTIVSHDLRTPLNQITLSTSLLGRPLPADVHARQLGAIMRSTEKMTRLLQDLLDVACIEAGRLSVDLRPVAVDTLLTETVEMFSQRCQLRSIRLELELMERGLQLFADEQRLVQALGNLLSNALKFTPEGGRIVVSASRLEDQVLISVSNTGPAIPDEHLPYLFERFWKARAHDRRGIGMGLAIVRGIVEAHGGRAWAENEQAAGPTFCFTIPIAREPAPPRDSEPAGSASHHDSGPAR